MLRVNSISNVNNTLKNISFQGGVRTNYGVEANRDNLVNEGIFTGFVGVLKESPFFSKKVSMRAESIEKGLSEVNLGAKSQTGAKLDKIA